MPRPNYSIQSDLTFVLCTSTWLDPQKTINLVSSSAGEREAVWDGEEGREVEWEGEGDRESCLLFVAWMNCNLHWEWQSKIENKIKAIKCIPISSTRHLDLALRIYSITYIGNISKRATATTTTTTNSKLTLPHGAVKMFLPILEVIRSMLLSAPSAKIVFWLGIAGAVVVVVVAVVVAVEPRCGCLSCCCCCCGVVCCQVLWLVHSICPSVRHRQFALV